MPGDPVACTSRVPPSFEVPAWLCAELRLLSRERTPPGKPPPVGDERLIIRLTLR